MGLVNYFKKQVKITFDDGEEMTGKIVNYTIAGDNDPEEESVEFIPDSGRFEGENIEVYQHEVNEIKEINA